MNPDNSMNYNPPTAASGVAVKKWLIVIGVILVILAVLLASLKLYAVNTFRVVSVSPATTQMPAVAKDMEVTFSKPLLSSGLSVTSSPNVLNPSSVQGKVLTINFKSLTANKSYTITINSIYATSHQKIANKTLTFTAKDIAWDKLPSSAQQALLDHQKVGETALSDPIFRYLPYSTLDFSIDSTDTNNKLVIEVQLLLAPGVTGDEATADTAQYKQEALDYLISKKIDPSKYDIQYQVVNESLNGT